MKKGLMTLSILFILLGGIFSYEQAVFFDGKLHIVFCSVGEGDGIFIRTETAKNILIDGGPNDSILSCLSKHMPFWDRKIDVIFLSHPHADHLTGLISVLNRYEVIHYVTEKVENGTILEKAEKQLLADKNLTANYFSEGDKLVISGKTQFLTIWPPKEMTNTRLKSAKKDDLDVNGFAMGQLLTYGNFKVLFTSDLEIPAVDELAKKAGQVTVLKVSHHGSKNGLDKKVLDFTRPGLAVISVGKNSYGHPTSIVLGHLKTAGIKTLRTDQVGDIEVISDGKTYQIKN
jgi:competence protein ComEC